MKQPKFQIGEEVILQSVQRPEENREDVVVEINHPTILDPFWGYKLSQDNFKSNEWWHESALKKKHKPSELSFKQLMDQCTKIPGTVK